ncbi:hypothetical protein HY008_02355 [Candidatus Woesebacteria bacterium]|nr:hypothetical protein [Candidatus Woesebacteria bacterium]
MEFRGKEIHYNVLAMSQKVSRFILLLAVFLFVIRVSVLLFFSVFGNSSLGAYLVHDSLHHYQIGIVLIILSLILRFLLKKGFSWLLPFGLALIIDEHAVFLKDIGLNWPYVYTTPRDTIIVSLLGILLMLFQFLSAKQG